MKKTGAPSDDIENDQINWVEGKWLEAVPCELTNVYFCFPPDTTPFDLKTRCIFIEKLYSLEAGSQGATSGWVCLKEINLALHFRKQMLRGAESFWEFTFSGTMGKFRTIFKVRVARDFFRTHLDPTSKTPPDKRPRVIPLPYHLLIWN